jgi:hypothetical protein
LVPPDASTEAEERVVALGAVYWPALQALHCRVPALLE